MDPTQELAAIRRQVLGDAADTSDLTTLEAVVHALVDVGMARLYEAKLDAIVNLVAPEANLPVVGSKDRSWATADPVDLVRAVLKNRGQ